MRPEEESQGPVIRDRRRIDPVTGQVRNPGESGPRRGPAPAGGQQAPGRHSASRPGGASGSSGARGDATPPGDETGSPAPDAQAQTASGGASSGAGSEAAAGEANRGAADQATAQTVTMLAERTADLQRLQAEYANYRKRVERDRLAVREQALANVLTELVPVLDDIGRAREHGELTGGFKSVGDSLEAIAVKLGLTSFGENGDPFDPTLHEALMHSYSAEVTEPTAVQILQPGYKVGERIIRPARVAVAEPGSEAPEETETGTGTGTGTDQDGPVASAGDDTDAGDGTGDQ